VGRAVQEVIRVLLLGTGQMGSAIGRLVHGRPGLELVGAYGRRAHRAGTDLGRAIGLERELDIPVAADLEVLLQQVQPDIAIQATCSRVADAMAELDALVTHGVHVISIAEEMAYPVCAAPDYAEQLHWQAVAKGVAVLGTGINPGFVLDTLVLTLSAVCADITSIHAERVNDLAPYGPSVLNSQGVGLTPEGFRQGVAQGTVLGHVGFPESIHMIAAAIGWDIERIDQQREPIVATVRRETPFVTVEPGQVAGCLHTATAYRHGTPVITLVHPQQVLPELEDIATGDRIQIRGTPDIELAGSPEIPGGEGTVALAVNMIPRVINAEPGLHSMADLPLPHAMLGDSNRYIHRI
jgi:4-hydroxy-tetrahydrodipicolinate reductase